LVIGIKCTSKKHLQEFYHQVLKERGEGVILRKPNSMYEFGRSKALLKYKPNVDEEALLLGPLSTDKHKWQCKTKSGTTFSADCLPSLGERLESNMIVTVIYGGQYMNGKPRKPRISTIRHDMTLQQFLREQ